MVRTRVPKGASEGNLGPFQVKNRKRYIICRINVKLKTYNDGVNVCTKGKSEEKLGLFSSEKQKYFQ